MTGDKEKPTGAFQKMKYYGAGHESGTSFEKNAAISFQEINSHDDGSSSQKTPNLPRTGS